MTLWGLMAKIMQGIISSLVYQQRMHNLSVYITQSKMVSSVGKHAYQLQEKNIDYITDISGNILVVMQNPKAK